MQASQHSNSADSTKVQEDAPGSFAPWLPDASIVMQVAPRPKASCRQQLEHHLRQARALFHCRDAWRFPGSSSVFWWPGNARQPRTPLTEQASKRVRSTCHTVQDDIIDAAVASRAMKMMLGPARPTNVDDTNHAWYVLILIHI